MRNENPSMGRVYIFSYTAHCQMNASSLSNTHNTLKANLETHSHPLNGLILPNLTKNISGQKKSVLYKNLWQGNRFFDQANFQLAQH